MSDGCTSTLDDGVAYVPELKLSKASRMNAKIERPRKRFDSNIPPFFLGSPVTNWLTLVTALG